MKLRALVARNIRSYRMERGWSQERLAHEAGVTAAYVGHLERQRYAASVDVLEKLAGALGIDPAQLLAKPKEPRRRS
jgi:transcriptional regulator with XRE-family HTH domain